MRIVPIEEIGQKKWDAFVDASDQAWFFHLYDLIKAKAFWPNHRNDSFAVIDDNEKICGIFPLHHISGTRMKIFPHHTLNSLGSMAVDNANAGTKRETKIWDFCKDHLIKKYKNTGTIRLDMWVNAMIPSLRGERCPQVNPLVLHGFDNALTQTWVVDLRKPEEELLSAMAENYRSSLRKAEKENTLIRQATASEKDLSAYYELHTETVGRSRINPHPRAYFENIWSRFVQLGLCKILMAHSDDKIIAAINYACYKGAAIYWTGAATKNAYDLHANHLLHWQMIKTLKQEKYEWVEIGEAIFNGENSKHISISDFKSRMGGALYPYYKASMKIK